MPVGRPGSSMVVSGLAGTGARQFFFGYWLSGMTEILSWRRFTAVMSLALSLSAYTRSMMKTRS